MQFPTTLTTLSAVLGVFTTLMTLTTTAAALPASPTSPLLHQPPAPAPTVAVPPDSKIVGNFSHSCDQITLMNGYFLAATCSPILPGSPGPGSENGNGTHGHLPKPPPEFNQLDLNMCIGFDQGDGTGGPETGGGGRFGELIWQAM